MFYFNFGINNPWSGDGAGRDYLCKTIQLTKNKSFEIQIANFTSYKFFDLTIDARWVGSDHAGLKFELDVVGFFFAVQIYDHRHWDYETNTWEVYEETSK